jgi:hypothetical protein
MVELLGHQKGFHAGLLWFWWVFFGSRLKLAAAEFVPSFPVNLGAFFILEDVALATHSGY